MTSRFALNVVKYVLADWADAERATSIRAPAQAMRSRVCMRAGRANGPPHGRLEHSGVQLAVYATAMAADRRRAWARRLPADRTPCPDCVSSGRRRRVVDCRRTVQVGDARGARFRSLHRLLRDGAPSLRAHAAVPRDA